MSNYVGYFKNNSDELYTIEIESQMHSENYGTVELTMGEEPCVIESDSDGLFTPIKSRSCTVQFLTKQWHFDLYSPTAKGAFLRVRKGNDTIFYGYITPMSYDQSYTYMDEVEIEAVDALSVLKEYDYQCVSRIPTFQKIADIILRLLKNAGYVGNLYVPNSYVAINASNQPAFDGIYVSEANFFDDGDDHEPWKQYEVIEEIMRYLGWSICPYGNDVYIVDYKYIKYSDASALYSTYDISTGLKTDSSVSLSTGYLVDTNAYAPGEPSLSVDDVYNKIEISDNLYEIEDIAPDIMDEELHISVTQEQHMGVAESQWTTTTVTTDGWWLWETTTTSTTINGYEYQTICRLKPSTNWIHHFYRSSSIAPSTLPVEVINQDGMNYNDGDIGSAYTTGINDCINTHGCLVQHYAFRKPSAKLPQKMDWKDYLTFFVSTDKINANGTFYLNQLYMAELPVLEYTVPEEVFLKPSTGTSWITIKGDLWYQYNVRRDNTNVNIVNSSNHFYTTAPTEDALDVESMSYMGVSKIYNGGDTKYIIPGVVDSSGFINPISIPTAPAWGDGFEMWKMKVKLGDKYWNGTNWTATPSTFYLPYGNNPGSTTENEFFPDFKWVSIVPNTDFTDKVGEQAYCIPIYSYDNTAPSKGGMKITIYTPLLIPKVLLDYLIDHPELNNSAYYGSKHWYDVPPVIYVKDFAIDYVYTDRQQWYNQRDENKTNSDDIVYTNIINADYTKTYDDLELKINTQQPDKPISRSYAVTDSKYVNTISHAFTDSLKGNPQEVNLLELYHDHYSEPKRIYECNIHGMLPPYKRVRATAIGGYYMVDSQNFDLKINNNRVKLIEY